MFIAGYQKALADHKIAGDYRNIVRGLFGEDGYTLAKDLLQSANPPTALIATEWITAAGIYRAADELGLSIPEDISVVGYGDNAYSWEYTPKLTAVGFSTEEAGKVSAEKLLAKLQGDDSAFASAVLPVKLYEADSTAPFIKKIK